MNEGLVALRCRAEWLENRHDLEDRTLSIFVKISELPYFPTSLQEYSQGCCTTPATFPQQTGKPLCLPGNALHHVYTAVLTS